MFENFLPLGQLYRLAIVGDFFFFFFFFFFCITLLWGGLKLANLVWLKNCGRWFV